jgi:hypothetical protein
MRRVHAGLYSHKFSPLCPHCILSTASSTLEPLYVTDSTFPTLEPIRVISYKQIVSAFWAVQSFKVRLSWEQVCFCRVLPLRIHDDFPARPGWLDLTDLLHNSVDAPLKRNPYLSEIVKRSRIKKHEHI